MTCLFKIRFVILKYRNNQVNDFFLEICCKLCSVFLFALQHVHHEKQGREKKIAPILSRPRHFVLVLPRPFISQGMVQIKLSMARTSFGFAQTTLIVGNGMERTAYGPVFIQNLARNYFSNSVLNEHIYIYICLIVSSDLTVTKHCQAKQCIFNYFVTLFSTSIYIYIYITNCRQYCFGLLGLISAVLMLGWR